MQIPAVLIKYFLIGISEKGGIGTLSISSGSISTIFPTIMIVICISSYLYKGNTIYIVLSVFYLLFGIIGSKRAIIIFIPIGIILTYLIYMRHSTHKILKGMSMIIFTLLMLYFTIRLIPTLNPDNKIWGKYSTEFVLDWTVNYTDLNSSHSFQETRRKDGLIYFAQYLKNKSPLTFLTGEGAGKIIKMKSLTGIESTMEYLYGMRYGGRMGFIWLYLQVGLLGLLTYTIPFILILFKAYKLKIISVFSISLVVITIIIIIDNTIYSKVFFMSNVIQYLYFFLTGLVFRQSKIQIIEGNFI
jgi:4-amino-4-deoxy-L-arabinose transferase-like glycosyltransferase